MQTNSLVTLIKKQFPDWSRQMILEFIDEVQRIVFTRTPTRQMQVLDTTTGKDPVITVSSAAEYSVSTSTGFPADVWRVTEVYETDITEPADVICYDATIETPARIVFSEPVSGQYYVRAYRFPTKIETESIQLEIPESYHITHVLNGVAGLIEQTRSGRSERWDYFLQRQLNEIVKGMSNGRSSIPDCVTPRGY